MGGPDRRRLAVRLQGENADLPPPLKNPVQNPRSELSRAFTTTLVSSGTTNPRPGRVHTPENPIAGTQSPELSKEQCPREFLRRRKPALRPLASCPSQSVRFLRKDAGWRPLSQAAFGRSACAKGRGNDAGAQSRCAIFDPTEPKRVCARPFGPAALREKRDRQSSVRAILSHRRPSPFRFCCATIAPPRISAMESRQS